MSSDPHNSHSDWARLSRIGRLRAQSGNGLVHHPRRESGAAGDIACEGVEGSEKPQHELGDVEGEIQRAFQCR
jgi:hypothetical protein